MADQNEMMTVNPNALVMVNPFEALETGRKRAYAGYEEGQAAAQRQALNELYAQALDPRTGELNVNALYSGLAQRGMGARIPELQSEQAKVAKLRGEAMQETTKGLEGRMQYFKRMIPADKRLAAAWVEAAYADPIVGAELSKFGPKEAVISQIPTDDAGYAKWAEGASMFADKLSERRTLTAEQQEAVTTQRRGQDIQAATTRRGQDIERATKERAQNLERFFGTAGAGTEDKNVVARTETAADGTVRFYNKFGDLLKTEKGAGKPSATFERTKANREQTQRDLSGALATLKEVVKPGGLIEQSTGSGAGRAFDVAAGFFGGAPEGAIAIGKLQPLADQILKLVPRFEGPQSDKDTQSYKEAAGQLANPTLPRKIRKAAANTLIGLFEKRKNQFTTAGAEAETGGDWQDL